ncbi:unnamed protein product [Caenorhabditis sp. 36 PRJEB53466]|nr:unnamed protein product [Caenorhabditis sp. 36 PRJEB53466]
MPLKPGANPYKILLLEKGCTEKDIQKAYRAQCLKWHPDKNLDNKEEASLRFIEAKDAFEFLYDKEKREVYDKGEERIRVAEEKQKQRMEKADGHRKKLIEDLEKREKDFNDGKRPANGPIPAAQQAKKKKTAEANIREEMDAIRRQLEKEANDEVKRQQEMMKAAKKEHQKNLDKLTPKLLVKWKVNEGRDYEEDHIRDLFSSDKRKVIVEFEPGTNAWGAELETGKEPMPELTGEWIEMPPKVEKKKPEENGKSSTGNNFEHMSLEDLEAQIMGGI